MVENIERESIQCTLYGFRQRNHPAELYLSLENRSLFGHEPTGVWVHHSGTVWWRRWRMGVVHMARLRSGLGVGWHHLNGCHVLWLNLNVGWVLTDDLVHLVGLSTRVVRRCLASPWVSRREELHRGGCCCHVGLLGNSVGWRWWRLQALRAGRRACRRWRGCLMMWVGLGWGRL